jgi:hypothetical protein
LKHVVILERERERGEIAWENKVYGGGREGGEKYILALKLKCSI